MITMPNKPALFLLRNLTALLLMSTSSLVYASGLSVVLNTNESPPFWSQTMPHQGFCGEIIEALSKRSGVQTTITFVPLTRMISDDSNNDLGNPSFFLGNQDFAAIIPIAVYHISMFQYLPNHKQKLEVQSLADLKGYRVGMLKGTLVDRSAFLRADIALEESYSQDSLFKKLRKGRLDFVIEIDLVGNSLIEQLFKQESSQFNHDTLTKFEAPIAILISTQQPHAQAIASAFRSALEEIIRDGTYDTILNKYYSDNDLVPASYIKQLKRFSVMYQEQSE